ncbi:hypothetical protein BDZ45DRAFT_675929 [Acephala macrosclerotiorum]|nr:hypothetical protein BDZ45DRAFT_675929 [Acephala macrosclerotiorum]
MDDIVQWFEGIWEDVREFGICDRDWFNMDETSFRISVGKSELVLVRQDRAKHRRAFIADPENRDLITAVYCISSAGYAIPALLLLAAV